MRLGGRAAARRGDRALHRRARLPGAAQAGAAAFRGPPRAWTSKAWARSWSTSWSTPASCARRPTSTGSTSTTLAGARADGRKIGGQRRRRDREEQAHDARALHLRARHPPRRRGDRARISRGISAASTRCSTADEAALAEVPDVGPVLAESIARFFAEPHNREVIAQLRAAGVHWPETAPQRAAARPARRDAPSCSPARCRR